MDKEKHAEMCRGLEWLFKRFNIPLDIEDIAKLWMDASYLILPDGSVGKLL